MLPFDKKLGLLNSIFIFMLSSPCLHAENTGNKLVIGDFSSGSIKQWESKAFKDETKYQLTRLDGTTVLKAESAQSASGLFKKQRIDLKKTPILNWRWRTENQLGNLNEQSKSGDDYTARIYVVVSGGLAFWDMRAINYVWASTSPKGKVWPNAYVTDDSMTMIALRSSKDKTGNWYAEKRNILVDLKRFIGEDIDYIDAVAIMTDTDNSKGAAVAYYGDIYFTEN
jgi:Protein of unknown function (DUF3047)